MPTDQDLSCFLGQQHIDCQFGHKWSLALHNCQPLDFGPNLVQTMDWTQNPVAMLFIWNGPCFIHFCFNTHNYWNCYWQVHKYSLIIQKPWLYYLYIIIKVIWVVEFQSVWVLKSKAFGQRLGLFFKKYKLIN